jgi:fucokinase
MNMPSVAWDYLVLTASNDAQASAYEFQLDLRRQSGLLPQVRETLVVPDLDGRRIGSGGSTLECLVRILEIERRRSGRREEVAAILRRLRILIVHAGGDSRRLPAYAPCGKIFVPLPTDCDAPLPATLFDRLVPDFLALPPGTVGRGQVLVAAGDALIRFDSSQVSFAAPGIVALGCYATPEAASRHGVFCIGEGDAVSVYLQKPSIAEQQRMGAINRAGQSALDVAVMSLDASAAEALLGAFGVGESPGGGFDFRPEARGSMIDDGIDMYREICCALGSAATLDHYLRSARSSGSRWTDEALGRLFPALNHVPLHVEIVPSCRFLHFGSTRQLIESGMALVAEDRGAAFFPHPSPTVLAVNCRVAPPARIVGGDAWIEACRIEADLELAGGNVLVGLDVDAPLALPRGACLEVLAGRNRTGEDVWFVRCYGIRDSFKDGQFFGRTLLDWLRAVGLDAGEVWPGVSDAAERALWNARIFPAERSAADFRRWLWMFAPETASAQELQEFRAADRYSAADLALLSNQEAFHARRLDIWRSRLPKPCATE